MRVNNNICQMGKITISIETWKMRGGENVVKHIAYKYGDIGNGNEVYQTWLVATDNDYVIETNRATILAQLDNISTCLKRRWRNQGKSVAVRLDLEGKLDTAIATFQG